MSPLFRRKSKKQAQESAGDAVVKFSARESGVENVQRPEIQLAEHAVHGIADSEPELIKADADSLDLPQADLGLRADADGDLQSAGAQGVAANLALVSQKSQEELAAGAYTAWHAHLTQQVTMRKDQKAPAKYVGQIDITHAHPTGVAQFYAHMEIRLSSLIREPKAFARAKEQLAQLRELTADISNEYGYAPVSLAAGRITWTELPELDTREIPQWTGQTYDATGELRLDFGEYLEQQKVDISHAQMQDAGADDAQKSEDAGVLATHEVAAAVSARAAERPLRTATERTIPALLRAIRIVFLPDGDAKLKLSAEAMINPELIHALRLSGIEPEHVAKLREYVQRSTGIDAPLAQITAISRAYLPGFKFENQNIIGCFHAPAEMLLADLEGMAAYVQNSGVVAALAGDLQLRKVTSAPILPGLQADRLPEVERGVGDLDPAELDVVEVVASGRSIVIDAPAGTRRLETLASIMADAAASGKSLIFVPSRALSGAALRAELEQLGLGEMVLDFSDVESVPHQIRTGLRLRKPDFDFASAVAQRDELTATRAQLDSFVTDLHQVNPDWGYSVHDLLEKLARLTAQVDAPTTRVRFTADTLAAIKIAGEDEVLQLLNRGAEIGIFSAEVAKSAWSNSSITDLQVGASAVERARRLHEVILPAVRAQVARSAGETGLHPAQTPSQWFEQIDMFDGISQSLDFFLPKIFESSVEHLIALTASKEWRSEHQISLSLSQKRMYRRELADLLRPGAVPADIHRELVLVEERREIWKRYTKDAGWPTLPSGMLQIQASRKVLASELTQLAAEVGGFGYLDIDFVKTSKIVEELVKDAAQMVQLPALNEVRGQLKRLGIEHFVADLRERNVTRDQLSQEFELAVTSSIFEQLLRKSKLLAALGPRDLLALVEKFRKLDLAQVNSLSGPVQLAAINNMRAYARAHRNDTIRLDQLLAKYGVGILRDVIATYPRLVQLARPIWIVPPVVARDYIPQMHWVDLVLCDTTERTELAAIIPSLLRGRQLVIVGDKRRNELIDVNALPADSHDVPAAAQVAEGDIDLADLGQARAFPSFAKIFPVLQLPTLRVQYDEKSARALLAHGYQDAYLPIPESPMKRSAQLISVDGRGVPSANGDGAVESTAAEVDAVVDLILNYALDQNPQSLAVITVSPVHARQILKALQNAKSSSVILQRFMNQNVAEPFHVVDISQTCGMRRDHVILSPGFGKTVHGRVLHSFGQLQESHGFLDLIDALEVARKSLTVVSALGVDDIDTGRLSTPGPKLLAQIIAEAGNARQDLVDYDHDTADPLLADFGDRLREQGFAVAYEYGFAGSRRLPMVVGMPDSRDAWEMAVLIDNADYVAEESLRRRDRFLPQAVADRGWLVFQTFSTSLFIDPAGQAAEVGAHLRALHSQKAEPELVPPILDGENWVEEPIFADVLERKTSRAAMGNPEMAIVGEDSTAQFAGPRERSARPKFTPGLQLSAYTDDQLDEVLAWIASDGIARTQAQFIQELRAELGIIRHGVQISTVLGNVVRRSGFVRLEDNE